MLAYVFWHRPYARISRAGYESALARFHEGLARTSCPGLKASTAFRITEAPWLGGRAGYEDWYLIEASWALDPLNNVAVAGPMEASHGDIAAAMETGFGGLYALDWGDWESPSLSRVLWLARPRGIEYGPVLAAFRARLGGPLACWRRQLVLGPAEEFAVVVSPDQEVIAPESWTAAAVDRTRLWPPP